MQAIDIDRKLIDGYLQLFQNLSSDSKLELISGLSDSMKSKQDEHNGSLRELFGDFIPEKSADTITRELKEARNFTRDIDTF
jgi:hypothetical protein